MSFPRVYLSQVLLDVRHPQTIYTVGDCQGMKSLILRAVTPVGRIEQAARAETGVLYHLDRFRVTGTYTLIVQSQVEPNWKFLLRPQADQFGSQFPAAVDVRVKEVGPTYEAFRPNQKLTFKLTAGPNQTVPYTDKERELLTRGHKVHQRKRWLTRYDEQVDWLVRQFEGCADLHDVHLTEKQIIEGKQSTNLLRFRAITFNGMLYIHDVNLFREKLLQGVGPGKPYGLGMLRPFRLTG